ncbi:hypothetical protein ACH5RR_001687 [Cinchona calisaya]|uniref:RNase H type-1 domain-containing protein n=1 Tax=Cinchona calisaya TaxID=153742 RepID=A0ABD3B4E0_9GENT
MVKRMLLFVEHFGKVLKLQRTSELSHGFVSEISMKFLNNMKFAAPTLGLGGRLTIFAQLWKFVNYHKSIFVSVRDGDVNSIVRPNKKRFLFEAIWIKGADCEKVIRNSCSLNDDPEYKLENKLADCKILFSWRLADWKVTKSLALALPSHVFSECQYWICFDRVISKRLNTFNIGVVIYDKKRGFIAGLAKKFDGHADLLLAEAFAISKAALLAKNLGISEFLLFGDTYAIIQ